MDADRFVWETVNKFNTDEHGLAQMVTDALSYCRAFYKCLSRMLERQQSFAYFASSIGKYIFLFSITYPSKGSGLHTHDHHQKFYLEKLIISAGLMVANAFRACEKGIS